MASDDGSEHGDAGAPRPAPAPACNCARRPKGAYRLWVANEQGDPIDPIDPNTADTAGREPDPDHPDAVGLHWKLRDPDQPPPSDQNTLRLGIEQALHALRRRFLGSSPPQPARFRACYRRVFALARRGLEGDTPQPQAAADELACLLREPDMPSPAEDNAAPGGSASAPRGLPGAGSIPQGAYKIWVTDENGDFIGLPTKGEHDAQPDPGNRRAVDLYFGLMGPPPKEQFALQLEIDKVLRACQRLYLHPGAAPAPKFRIYYTRLFHIAELGLVGEHPLPEVARIGLNSIAADLLDDEGATIKNGYLSKLGTVACLYAGLALLVYALLNGLPESVTVPLFVRLRIDLTLLSSLLLLWVGCFAGVWLSYGIRKTKLTLIDLTSNDDDRLAPPIRLLFAGLLTMLLGMLFALDLIEVRIGSVSLTNIQSSPLHAFIVGAFCGISELALPVSISKRATSFVENMK